jgi:hypothetical protein
MYQTLKDYRHVLESLGKQKGRLGVIFRKAQNKIQIRAKLRPTILPRALTGERA